MEQGRAIPLMKSVNMQETKKSREIDINYNKNRHVFTGIADRIDLKDPHHENLKEQLIELKYTESHVCILMDKLQPVQNIQVQIDENWEEFTLCVLAENLRRYVERNPITL